MTISDELIRQFMNFGLSKQQATSTTTAKLVEYFMPDEGKSLILEAKRQVSAMEDMVNMLDNEYHKLVRKMLSYFRPTSPVGHLEQFVLPYCSKHPTETHGLKAVNPLRTGLSSDRRV